MLVEERTSVEAVLDERDPSRLRIDIRVHPVGGGSSGSELGELQRLIREGFRDAQLDRLMLASNPQPKRGGFLGRVLTFVVCAGLGAVATIALSAYHPRPSAIASLEDLGTPVATPGSQSSPVTTPPQSPGSAGSAENQPGPGTFGLHQQ
jgi:hypothetical protein